MAEELDWAKYDLEVFKAMVGARVDLLKAYADYNYRMMEALKLRAEIELDLTKISIMRDAFKDFQRARKALLKEVQEEDGNQQRIADRLKYVRRVSQGQHLPAALIPQVWIGFNAFLSSPPIDVELELTAIEITSQERTAENFSYNRDPIVQCEDAPEDVRQARDLIEFMRKKNYMPRTGTPAMRCVYEVVKVLSDYASEMSEVIKEDLAAAQTELKALREMDWKNIDIAKPPKTPQDAKGDKP